MSTWVNKSLVCIILLTGFSAHSTPTGNKWFSLPVSYRVFNHSQINGVSNFSSNVLPGVQAAFNTWGQANCTSWAVTYSGGFSSPSGTSAINGSDRINNVIWLTGSQWRHGSTTLGLTTTAFFSGSGEIIDADMEMNNNVTWSISSSGSNNAYDMQSVVLHEVGHFLGLDHTTSSSGAVMFPTVPSGTVKRSLATPDVNDVCTVYPGTPGGQGSPCSSNATCTQGRVCRGPSGSTSKICTADCTSGQTCPTGYTCQNADSGKACLLPAGSPDLCKFCTNGTQCSTGICVTNGRNNWCSMSCTSATSCGSGYDCTGGYCVPTSSCNAQCTSNSQCAIGYECVGNQCQATGRVGDRCESSAYCEPCSLCIGTTTTAYCRGCCGGQNAGGACNSCPGASCGTGLNCQQITGGTDKVCVPNSGAALCAACSTSTPCAAGYTCFGGRCHAACNPASPGACAACYDAGGGQGYCACPGQTRKAGETCGIGTNGALSVCEAGLRCVGQVKPICRKTCDLNVSGSCDANEQCQSVDGATVCVPQIIPGKACSPCSNGQCEAGLTCLGGRCYTSCNPEAPECTSCVETTNGSGVCACADQRAGVDQFCGFVAPVDVYTCQAGYACADEKCRQECNLSSPDCPADTSCQTYDGLPVCLPGNVPVTDDGAGGPKPIDNGCGCTSTSADALFGISLVTLWVARRRRRGQA